MLSFAILLFIALIMVLFVLDFGTDLKPGVMTKIKTLLAHFQVSFQDVTQAKQCSGLNFS